MDGRGRVTDGYMPSEGRAEGEDYGNSLMFCYIPTLTSAAPRMCFFVCDNFWTHLKNTAQLFLWRSYRQSIENVCSEKDGTRGYKTK